MAFVSGIAAAESDNSEYISGASYNAPISLHPFLLNSDIEELDNKLKSLFDFIKDNTEVDVINMSFGISAPQNTLPDAADALVDLISKGTVVVSTPNDGKDYPLQGVSGLFPHRINSLRDEK
jgi:subtilisin family serine protease